MTEQESAATPNAAAHCPWCAAPTGADASQCPACGAALAQRESIGDLMIPGLTSVAPELQDFDKRPLHLRGPSAAQGMAPVLMIGAIAGGPVGMAAIGGVAAVAAAEYMGAGGGGGNGLPLEDVGRPSEVVLQALDKLGDDPGRESATTPEADAPEAPVAANDGRDIWRDLPEPALNPDSEEERIDGV